MSARGQVLPPIDSSEYLSRLSDRQASFQAARGRKQPLPRPRGARTRIAAEESPSAVQRGHKTAVDGKLFIVVDLSRLELEALVPANEIAQIAVGQSFVATLDGYGNQRFPGRVARIGPSAQTGSRYVPIYIEIANPAADLKTGLFAEGLITLDQRRVEVLVRRYTANPAPTTSTSLMVDGADMKRTLIGRISVNSRYTNAGTTTWKRLTIDASAPLRYHPRP